MIHNKFRYLLTLVALFAISTGAWADVDAPNTKTFTVPDTWQHVFEAYTAADLPADFAACSDDEAAAWAAACTDEYAVLIYSIGNVYTKSNVASKDSRQKWQLHQAQLMGYKIYYTPAPDVEVAWDASTKTGTFAMPGSDVVLTPQYAPAAQLDENGAPAAVSGLEIAADAAIITAGQSAQGTLLYAVGTSETEKPALTAFAATLPNAKDQTAAGNYYVWYYIQGQDTPQGQEPTAENTFNDSEIMGPVMVELLTNEHTLNIKQSPNITVTVAGTAKAVTDDKVTPVTTGQEVKIKAKDGYKFRKVEVVKVTYAEGHALTSAKFGEIVCSDGKAYAAADKDNLPKGVKAEALVCYADGEHGLALAMADVKNEKMSWDNDRGANDGKTAAEWCDGWNTSHPIAGATWLLASQTQWNNMISAAGSASNLSNAFSAVGGTNLQAWSYWSSTPNHGGTAAWFYYFPQSSWQWTYLNQDYTGRYIRACLEW